MYSIELQKIFYEYKHKNHIIITSFLAPGFNRIIFHFDIRGKLSIIRGDKYILFYNVSILVAQLAFLV